MPIDRSLLESQRLLRFTHQFKNGSTLHKQHSLLNWKQQLARIAMIAVKKLQNEIPIIPYETNNSFCSHSSYD